jgi:hypothetical protein
MRILFFLVLIINYSCFAQNNVDKYKSTQDTYTVNIVIIEKALDLKNFKPYLHLEIPDRNNISFYSLYPLQPNDSEYFDLFSKHVTILQKGMEHRNRNLIRLLNVTQSGSILNLTFDYKIEGIVINVQIDSKDNKYTVIDYKIMER